MEQAFLLVEEIKEAKDPSLQKTLLSRAVQHLASLPPLPVPSTAGAAETLEMAYHSLSTSLLPPSTPPLQGSSFPRSPSSFTVPNHTETSKSAAINQLRSDSSTLSPLASPTDRAWLWDEVIRISWERNFVEIALNATRLFLEIPWTMLNNKEISILVAQAHFMRAQALLSQNQQMESQSPLDIAVQHLLSGLRIGLNLMESWIIFNAVILIWNSYFSVIKQSRQNEITETLQECFQALIQITSATPITTPRDAELVASVANALACAYEQNYLRKKKSPEPADKPKRAGSTVLDAMYDLKQAEDVCKTALSLPIPAPAHKRALLATLTRVQRYRGVVLQTGGTTGEKITLKGPEGEGQVVSLLEVLATEPDSRKRDLLAKALDLLDQISSSNTELMTMIAVEYYSLGEYGISIQIAEQTLAKIPTEDKILETLVPKQWRWFAVNENLCGQNIVGLLGSMIKTEKGEKEKTRVDKERTVTTKFPLQQNQRTVRLYKMAADHFARGAKYGVIAQEKPLVIHAATNFWNASLPLIASSATRWLVLTPAQVVLQSLRGVQDTTWGLQIQLYKLYLSCLIDQKTWGEGLKVAEQALKRIPKSYHESLWEERIIFKSNIKRNVEPYALALKDNDKIMIARGYILIARTNSDQRKRKSAYQKAINALSEIPIESIPYHNLFRVIAEKRYRKKRV